MRLNAVLLAPLLAFVMGCASTIVVDGITVREDAWKDATPVVIARAQGELACDNIKLTLLEVHPAGSPQKVGAAGCGRTRTYVGSGAGWAPAEK